MYKTVELPLLQRINLLLKQVWKIWLVLIERHRVNIQMMIFAAIDLPVSPNSSATSLGSETDAAVRAWIEIVERAQCGHGLAVATATAQGAFTVRDRLQTEPHLAASLASAEVSSAAFAFALNRSGDFEVARGVAIATLSGLASVLPRSLPTDGDKVFRID
ncbi:hypothetical protein ACFZ8E_11560 [Methylobacterium sp. HMF5984]|uniref:hypothetical protein n=1 Tax=Methylobacterium sp. HMF5984 TaxID=3367370 RepID=UPI00385238A6